MTIKSLLVAAVLISSVARQDVLAAPDFGPNVLIFDPSMTNIQSQMDAVFAKQEKNQFGPERFAHLFKPGSYQLDVH